MYITMYYNIYEFICSFWRRIADNQPFKSIAADTRFTFNNILTQHLNCVLKLISWIVNLCVYILKEHYRQQYDKGHAVLKLRKYPTRHNNQTDQNWFAPSPPPHRLRFTRTFISLSKTVFFFAAAATIRLWKMKIYRPTRDNLSKNTIHIDKLKYNRWVKY